MVRVRLISSDSIDFGLDHLESDHLEEILKDIPDGEAAINVPFSSYTILGFLKDVNCQYQNANVLALRKLLGLRNLEEQEDDNIYDPNDETNYSHDESEYLIKIELESNASVSHIDLPDLEPIVDEPTDPEKTDCQHEAADQSTVVESLNTQEIEWNAQEANREDQTAVEMLDINVLAADIPSVSSLVEDDIDVCDDVDLCVFTDLQDEILPELVTEAEVSDPAVITEAEVSDLAVVTEAEVSDPAVVTEAEVSDSEVVNEAEVSDSEVVNEAEVSDSEVLTEVLTEVEVSGPKDVSDLRRQILRVRFVNQGLESIEDVKKAKGRKRKRGNK